MKGTELDEMKLQAVSGGIAYTPDKPNAKTGVLGFSSSTLRPYRYENEGEVRGYINSHIGDKEFKDMDEIDQYMIDGLLDAKLIKPV